jgi:hypothetical protein
VQVFVDQAAEDGLSADLLWVDFVLLEKDPEP